MGPVAVLAALAVAAAPPARPPDRGPGGTRGLTVSPRLVSSLQRPAAVSRDNASPSGAPPCVADVCQPRVAVPGMQPILSRPSRTELAVVYLERARFEPLATIGWALVSTGLRLDYTPPVLDGASRAPGGWGSVFLRVKFRLDADNEPVFPRRHAG
jgi:hypothetical protein